MKAAAPVLVVVFLVIAVAYWFGWLQIGASEPGPHHKHAIVFVVLAILAGIWGRFAGARRL